LRYDAHASDVADVDMERRRVYAMPHAPSSACHTQRRYVMPVRYSVINVITLADASAPFFFLFACQQDKLHVKAQ